MQKVMRKHHKTIFIILIINKLRVLASYITKPYFHTYRDPACVSPYIIIRLVVMGYDLSWK